MQGEDDMTFDTIAREVQNREPLTGADARAERVAKRIGTEALKVERLPFDLSVLDEDGLFLDVDACGFGILQKPLDWEAIGVSLPEGSYLALRPPICGLLPDQHRQGLLRSASRARRALRKYSFNFSLTQSLFGTPAFMWVPWQAFPFFEEEFNAARTDLETTIATIEKNYDSLREQVRSSFVRLGDVFAERLSRDHATGINKFTSKVVEWGMAVMPTPDDLKTKLSISYEVGVFVLGSEMLKEKQNATRLRREIEAEEAKIWAEKEKRRLEVVDAQRELEIKERLRQIKLDAEKARLKEALSPIEEGAKQLHRALYDMAVAIKSSLEKNGHLHGNSAKKARAMAQWFKLMNWQNDVEMEALVQRLESLAKPMPANEHRDIGSLQDVLKDIIDRTYADAHAITRRGRMAGLEL
jgi:hypothetical protein